MKLIPIVSRNERTCLWNATSGKMSKVENESHDSIVRTKQRWNVHME